MSKVAWKLIMMHKRWVIVFLVLMIGTMLSFSAFHFIGQVVYQMEERQATERYGSHHFVVMNSDIATEKWQQAGDQLGEWFIDDHIDERFSVGAFDNTAWRIGRLQLSQGRLPQRVDEVAIEEAFLRRWQQRHPNHTWQIGQARELPFERGRKRVKLVGIVRNYSMIWHNPYKAKRKAFPTVIIAAKYVTKRAKHHYLIKTAHSGQSELSERYQWLEQFDEAFINERLYNDGYGKFEYMNSASRLFQWGMSGLSVVVFFYFWWNFQRRMQVEDGLLLTHGYTSRQVMTVRGWQLIWLILLSVCCCMPFVAIGWQWLSFIDLLFAMGVLIFVLLVVHVWQFVTFNAKNISRLFQRRHLSLKKGRKIVNRLVIIVSLVTMMSGFVIFSAAIEQARGNVIKPQYILGLNESYEYAIENQEKVFFEPLEWMTDEEVAFLKTIEGIKRVQTTIFTQHLNVKWDGVPKQGIEIKFHHLPTTVVYGNSRVRTIQLFSDVNGQQHRASFTVTTHRPLLVSMSTTTIILPYEQAVRSRLIGGYSTLEILLMKRYTRQQERDVSQQLEQFAYERNRAVLYPILVENEQRQRVMDTIELEVHVALAISLCYFIFCSCLFLLVEYEFERQKYALQFIFGQTKRHIHYEIMMKLVTLLICAIGISSFICSFVYYQWYSATSVFSYLYIALELAIVLLGAFGCIAFLIARRLRSETISRVLQEDL